MSVVGKIDIEVGKDSISLQGDSIQFLLGKDELKATIIGGSRVLLHSTDLGMIPENPQASCICDAKHLYFLLIELNRSEFSGLVVCDTERGVKKLYFSNGELVFAGSSLIDDRLGEVLYRDDWIDIDQMTTSAVQVNREQKFGQVLISNGIFTPVDLASALSRQALEIFQSVFLVKRVFCQVFEQQDSPMSVFYEKSTRELLDEFYCISIMFKGFLKHLSHRTEMITLDSSSCWIEPNSGTFGSDIVALVREHRFVDKILSSSKLSDLTTFYCLFRFVNKGYLEVVEPIHLAPPDSSLTSLDILISGYQQRYESTLQAFRDAAIEFPLNQFLKFCREVDRSATFLAMKKDGEIADLSLQGLRLVWGHKPIKAPIRKMFEGISAFLAQLVLDFIPRKHGDIGKNQRD